MTDTLVDPFEETTAWEPSNHDLLPTRDPADHSADSTTAHETVVVLPRPTDIFCGRGKYMSHPGNKRFQAVIDRHRAAYQQADKRDDKSAIASRALLEVQSYDARPVEDTEDRTMKITQPVDLEPVRFLLKSPDQGSEHWTVVDDAYIKEKVAHALRSRPRATRKRQAQEMGEIEALETSREDDVASGVEAVVQSMLREQQALLKKLISEQVFLDQETAIGPPEGHISNSSSSSTAVLRTAESLKLNWRTCPMEKGLHLCHHLG